MAKILISSFSFCISKVSIQLIQKAKCASFNYIYLMDLSLQATLEKCNSTKIDLTKIKDVVLRNTDLLDELINMATDLNYNNHPKALRIVELITEDNPIFIESYIPQLIEQASHYKKCAAVRGISRILYFVVLTPEIKLNNFQKEALIEMSLEWFIGNEKVACKVNALKIMMHFSGQFPWLQDTLRDLIEKEYASQLPSYQIASRAAIKKFNQ